MNIGWYYSDELCPSDELVDKFADSKFGIDRWSSFAREIIQNSLDAQDDDNKPVEVEFNLNKELSLKEIPGGEKIKDILEKCMNAATNRQTKNSYRKGLEVLNKNKIYCLKISDKNTKGVMTGRDAAWGAFVFDEGKSIKQRPGSAGSHGVGKKVPFIISTCNTVFYATKNKYLQNGEEKSDCLVQGKTTLISWKDDDGKRKNSKGWYGIINPDISDPKNVVQPINSLEYNEINPYFVRKEEYGTDVIIIGSNIYDNEEEIKGYIISAVLENYFVAILANKLIVNVFGEKISRENFNSMVNKYYVEQAETKNNLLGCLRVYGDEPDSEKEIYDDKCNYLGKIKIYFRLGNEYNKKYYTIVRSHGMRITDYRVNKASQPYTAVVLIEGKELNDLLASLENAAHDSFIVKDENMDIDSRAVYAIEKVQENVRNYVIEKTKIDEQKGQDIESLNNIITIPGIVSSIKQKSTLPTIKRNILTKKGKGEKSKDYEGKTSAGGENRKTKKKGTGNKPAKKGDQFDSTLYEDYIMEPIFIKLEKKYELKFSISDEIKKAEIKIYSINSEGKKDDSINDYIESVNIDGQRRKCEKGKVKDVFLKKDETICIEINLKKNVTYQLAAEIFQEEKNYYE